MKHLEETLLYKAFQKYMQMSVVKNQHLIDVLFHVFCGIVFAIKLVYSGQYIRCRVCYFTIQESGSGKSQAMVGLKYLLQNLIPHNKILLCDTTTDAALIGSPDFNKKREANQARLLLKKEVLLWDEGSLLLKETPNAENLQDILQSATDEPGKIGKALKDGIITGETHTTIVAGSYFEDNIKYQLLRRGFFQRMFLTYKEFSDAEKLEIQKELGKLECETSYNERVKLENQIKDILIKEYGYQHGTPWSSFKVIKHNKETIKYFTDRCVEFYTNQIMYQYLDRRQKVLETFWNRARLLTLKISAQSAYLHHRLETTKGDVDYALDLIKKYHIAGIKELLNNLTDKKEVYKKIDLQTEKDAILKYIGLLNQEKKGAIIQKDLMAFVRELKRKGEIEEEKLHLGTNKVIDILKELEQEGKIDVKTEGRFKYMKVKALK